MLMCVDTWLLSTIVDKAALPIVSTNVAALTTYSTPLGGGHVVCTTCGVGGRSLLWHTCDIYCMTVRVLFDGVAE